MITALRSQLVAKKGDLKKDEGFTLIELLVVILIIGVLAAIAIPVFLGQQAQAQEAAAKANLANAKIAYSAYLVSNPDGSDTAPSTANKLLELGFPRDESVTIQTGGSDFCLQTTGAGSDVWSVSASESTPVKAACGGTPDPE